MSRVNYLKEMPFYGLSDFQLLWENETCKQEIIGKMTNNGFIDFMKKSDFYENDIFDFEQYKYYDIDEYNCVLKNKHQLNIIHLNCRLLSANRGKIMAFLNSLETEVDIILLSEIGREGYRYLKSIFPNYDYEIDIPQKKFLWRCSYSCKK